MKLASRAEKAEQSALAYSLFVLACSTLGRWDKDVADWVKERIARTPLEQLGDTTTKP